MGSNCGVGLEGKGVNKHLGAQTSWPACYTIRASGIRRMRYAAKPWKAFREVSMGSNSGVGLEDIS